MGSLRKNAYLLFMKTGSKALQLIFPEVLCERELSKPSDRYIEYPFAIRNLPPVGSKVLDVGCTGSFFPLILAGFGYDTYGIDTRKYSIINKINYPNFRFFQEDIRKTYFSSQFFDAITAISTVEHVGLSGMYGVTEDPDGDKKAVREMARVLKIGGCILMTVPYGKAMIIRPFFRIYDDRTLEELIQGLTIEKEEYYMQDQNGDWIACPKTKARVVVGTIYPTYRYALALLKLKKQ